MSTQLTIQQIRRRMNLIRYVWGLYTPIDSKFREANWSYKCSVLQNGAGVCSAKIENTPQKWGKGVWCLDCKVKRFIAQKDYFWSKSRIWVIFLSSQGNDFWNLFLGHFWWLSKVTTGSSLKNNSLQAQENKRDARDWTCVSQVQGKHHIYAITVAITITITMLSL